MPFLIPLILFGGGTLIGAATTIVAENALDGVTNTVNTTSNAVSNIGNTALLLGGLYLVAKWRKLI